MNRIEVITSDLWLWTLAHGHLLLLAIGQADDDHALMQQRGMEAEDGALGHGLCHEVNVSIHAVKHSVKKDENCRRDRLSSGKPA